MFQSDRKRCYVLMGPPSVGKTALLREVLKDFPNSFVVNLRASSFDTNAMSTDSLLSHFTEECLKWVQRVSAPSSDVVERTDEIKAGINLLDGSATVSASTMKKLEKLEADLKLSKPLDKESFQSHFFDVLKRTLGSMNEFSVLNGKEKRPAVFVIDEANRLKDLCTSAPEFKDFVRELLSTCVLFSKEKNEVFVVLATSDSFFIQFLKQLGTVSQHVRTMTLGDLTKDEAKKYYELRGGPVNDAEFDKIYGAVGGRMISLDDYAQIRPQNPATLSRVSDFYETLQDLHNPSEAPFRLELPNRPLYPNFEWTREEFVAVVRAIATSKHRAISSDEARKCCSRRGLSSMVQHNIICFRLDQQLAHDLPDLEGAAYTFLFPEDTLSAQKFLCWYDDQQQKK